MDACKVEPVETGTFLQKTGRNEDGTRPPLVASEKNNALSVATRKPQTREIASRIKSGVSTASSAPSSRPSTPKRSSSPSAERITSAPGATQPKRAVSAERKRPTTPSQRLTASSTQSSRPSTPSTRPSTPSSSFSRSASTSRSTTPVRDTVVDTHNTSQRSARSKIPDGLWPSMRNLSSSFQSESATTTARKKEKLVADSSNQSAKASINQIADRKISPLRRRNASDQSENSKPPENSNTKIMDQHRWPAMFGGRLTGNALSRSADLSDKGNRSALSSRGASPRRITPEGPGKSIQQSLTEVAKRLSINGNVRVDPNKKPDASSFQSSRTAAATRPSRTQSVETEQDTKLCANTTSLISERPSTASQPRRVRTVPASSLTRPSSPTPKLSRPSSPARSLSRPSSPSKQLSTTPSIYRGMLSPSRTRPSTPSSPSTHASSRLMGATSSIFNYISDFRKGKKTSNNAEDSHQLRILHNVYLQWRFVNAQVDETMMIQKMSTENALYNMWNIISTLCDSVITKRIDVQHLQQEMKLGIILNQQLEYLEHWASLESEHYSSLSEAADALKATTLRLPVIEGAKADIFAVKNAVGSAVDIMKAMGSSICYLISKIEGRKSLLSELAIAVAKEKAMLDECRELLGSAAALQVQESSLITHILQLRQICI